MPVPWALGNHGHRFDRFTSRCRIPEEIFQKRSDSDSTHMVCCDERNREYLYLCKAALAPDMTSTSISFDSSVAVPHTLSETWDFFPEKIQSYGTICFCWLPSNSIANASSITLELCSPRDENKYMNHSFIEDMIRHQFILHESAVINVRVPDHSKIKESDTTPIDCVQLRVTSTFPLKTFVRVGVTTRLIFLEKPSPAFCLPKKSTQEAEIIDLGGLWKELEALKDIIMLRSFLEESGMFTSSIDIPSGVLLYGPSGVGKTLLVRTLVKLCANKLDLSLKTINSGEIMSSGNGGVEHELRKAFMEAKLHGARSKTSCAVIFIDEIEVLCPIRECGRALHSRIVGQMLTLMDGIKKRNREKVIVIAATNLPNSIDPALRRAGRFDREIFVSPPDYKSRRDIFKLHLRYIPFHRNDSALIREQHIDQLATESVGFVGADIAAFCREALRIAQIRNLVSLDYDLKDAWWLKHEMTKEPSTMLSEKVCAAAWVSTPIILPPWYLVRAMNAKYYEELSPPKGDDPLDVTISDFSAARSVVTPASLRGKSSPRGGTSWNEIGGNTVVKTALKQVLEWPILYPGAFSRFNLTPPKGILLYGPPGCSKSSIAKAAAQTAGISFLTASIAQVYSPYFGVAEEAIRQIFHRARAAVPAIIFFDEIDTLVGKREFDASGEQRGSQISIRLLSTLLNEMDGVESSTGLVVIGATNRPESIDAALLRPGRFDRLIHVPLPSVCDRLEILKIHTQNTVLKDDVDLHSLSKKTAYFSGAELENLCREASLAALRESVCATSVAARHFEQALVNIHPVSTFENFHEYHQFAMRNPVNAR